MTPRLIAFVLLCLSCSAVQAHADDFPAPTVPPGLEAMWNGRDGAAVRADLRRIAAEGERPGTRAGQKMDAGECAYWLGVQDAREGRPDSALTQWRRALVLRGDFPEGFALIDALCRRGRPGDFAEARVQAEVFAQQTLLSMQQRAPEAHARLAWALHLLGRPDSAMAELRTHCPTIYRRPLWTRRFAVIALAAGDHAGAWDACVTLSARTRRRDAEAETLLVSCQRSLGYDNGRRQRSVDSILGLTLAEEEVFAHALGGKTESVLSRDGFRLQLFTFPALRLGARRAPMLFVLSPTDTIAAVDSLVAAVTRAGHPVALLAPRGSFGSLGRGAWGPEAWIEQRAVLEALVVADAGELMDQLARRTPFAGRGGWIVAGERATVALEVARARRNVAALVLVAPRVPSVAVAEFRARLRAIGTRTFVQTSPEEPDAMEFGELLVRDTPPGQVRVADSGRAGRGAEIFRGDTKVAERLLAWLAEKPRQK